MLPQILKDRALTSLRWTVVLPLLLPASLASATSVTPSIQESIILLNSPQGHERIRAIELLGNSGNSAAMNPLVTALSDTNMLVREAAALALGRLKDSRAVEPLHRALKDSEWSVRQSVVTALEQIGDSQSVDPLLEALLDREHFVTANVAQALGVLKDRRAVDSLIPLLKDTDSGVREQAVRALGLIKDPRARLALEAALDDSEPTVRDSVAEALGSIGDNKAVSALAARLPNWDRQWSIGASLTKLGYVPATTRGSVYYWISTKSGNDLIRNWDTAHPILIEDVISREKRRIENAVYTFISMGRQELIPELEGLLHEHGSKEMVETYVNSGNVQLDRSARAWWAAQGGWIVPGAGRHDATWGGWR